MATLLSALRAADESLTGKFDFAFAPVNNPWRHLGALAFLCLVTLVATGVVAFALYDTSVTGAYDSGLRLQNDPLLLGRLLRGLHRYAADGFMVLTVLHLLREAMRGHFRGVRWFSWITGIPLLWMLWIAGITGLWLLWDERALFSLTATAEWLQALPLAADLLARNILTPGALNDRFFSLIMFVHIGVPLLLVAAVWVHVQRISLPRLWPPRALTAGFLTMLSILAVSFPAQSLGPANTTHVAAELSLDWLYLFPHPLVNSLTAHSGWMIVATLTVILAILPWLVARGKATRTPLRAAQVDLANCNGCARCAADCPFGAVIMIPRTDQRHHRQQASVVNDLCAACGICVGACPSSTPFRRIEEIVSGIEMPDAPIVSLRHELQQKLAAMRGSEKVVVFCCRQAAEFEALADHSTAVIALECVGMLPPSFIEYATRLGAVGVTIAGCREADCEFRLGDRWLQERLEGSREPRLRAAAPRDRLAVILSGREIERVREAISTLRRNAKPSQTGATPTSLQEAQHD